MLTRNVLYTDDLQMKKSWKLIEVSWRLEFIKLKYWLSDQVASAGSIKICLSTPTVFTPIITFIYACTRTKTSICPYSSKQNILYVFTTLPAVSTKRWDARVGKHHVRFQVQHPQLLRNGKLRGSLAAVAPSFVALAMQCSSNERQTGNAREKFAKLANKLCARHCLLST